MDPDRRTVPRGCVGSLVPGRGDSVSIEHVVQLCDRGPRVGISHCQRDAAAKVVCARTRAAGGVDPLQRSYELRERDRRLAKIRDALDDRVLAWEPSADRPMPWVALGGHPLRERHRDSKRQMRRQSRQPLMLLVNLSGSPLECAGVGRTSRRRGDRSRCRSRRSERARWVGLPNPETAPRAAAGRGRRRCRSRRHAFYEGT